MLISISAFIQLEDTAYIADYANKNDVELYNGYNIATLHFNTPGKTEKALNLFSNNGLFIGV